MKTAIVLGATGGAGKAMVLELLNRGVHVIAFGRSKEKLQTLMNEYNYTATLEYKLGDIFDFTTIVEAAKEADVIFQCANVKYQEMEEKLLQLGESVMEAAEVLGAKIVFVDGIYVYGRQIAKGDENHPQLPHTKKGKIRVDFEKLIFSSKWSYAKPLIVRLPDYYGPTSQNSYLQFTLEGIASQKVSVFLGNLKTPREYVYLPDAAKMIVNIAEKDDTYGEAWHIPGAGLISGKQIIQIARKVTGNQKIVIPLKKNAIRLIGLFDPLMKEVVEMMYLTKEGFVLSGKKYEERIGPVPKTSFQEGLEVNLRYLMAYYK